MITRIEAKRYRCFENIGIDIPQYAVLIGSNEAGKTTFLDIPRLVADCLGQENINHAFVEGQQGRNARCMTVSELVHRANGNEFFIALEAALPKEIVKSLIPGLPTVKSKEAFWPTTIRYELRLEIAQKTQLQVKNEYLFVFAQKNKPARGGARMLGTKPHQDWRFVISRESNDKAHIRAEAQKGARAQVLKVDATTLALRHIPAKSKKDYPAAVWLSNLLTKNILFYQPDTKSLKTPSPLGSPAKPIASAANLPHLALELKKQDRRCFKLWQDHVKEGLPNLEKIEVKKSKDGHTQFHIHYQGNYTVTNTGLSEGTLSFLALTILPYLNKHPPIIFVEKPENDMSPGVIELILQSLSCAYESQVLVSTHSPVVVANCELSELLCLRLNATDGSRSIIVGSDHPEFKGYKGSLILGAFFESRMLG